MADPKSFRLHPILDDMITVIARQLKTSRTWIVESALAQYFGDELRQKYPTYRPGMPHKEDDKK